MNDQMTESWSLSAGEAVGPQLYRKLHEQIVRAELMPGERISEAEIAQRFGLSRQPVREAFIKLSEEYLVEVKPQRGTFVRKIDIDMVKQGRFVREAVEADIVKEAARRAGEADRAKLRDSLERQREAQQDSDAFIVLDEEFHRLIAKIADKEHAWRMVQSTKVQMDRVRHLSARTFPIGKLVVQHAAIAQALMNGDSVSAETAMRAHLREVLKDLPAIVNARPDLFEGGGS